MSRAAATSSATVIVCVMSALLVSPIGLAFAQAGSTGGTIGKTDKSVSGGEDAAVPRTPAKSRSKSQGPIDRDTSGQSSVSVVGPWRWIADCNNGHWEGQFDLVETSRGQFNGSFDPIGTISDGHINGTSVTFTRKWGAVFVQYWSGQLAAGRIRGTLSGASTCSWEASRK
jgi:hypothetical protein